MRWSDTNTYGVSCTLEYKRFADTHPQRRDSGFIAKDLYSPDSKVLIR